MHPNHLPVTNGGEIPDDQLSSLVSALERGELVIRTENRDVPLPEPMVRVLHAALTEATGGDAVAVHAVPDPLPVLLASEVGMSPSLLRALIEAGEVPTVSRAEMPAVHLRDLRPVVEEKHERRTHALDHIAQLGAEVDDVDPPRR